MFREGRKPVLENLWSIFPQFGRYFCAYLAQFVRVFLWMLLLIVPGIIKLYAYSMMFYVMRDNQEMSGTQALRRSEEMMKGHKMEYFILMLSFVGWYLLSILTLFIGMIWLIPYVQTANAAFYEKLKKAEDII